MFYENELRFLCEILKKCRVRVSFNSPEDPISKMLDDNFRIIFSDNELNMTFRDVLHKIDQYTIYRMTDPLKFNYMFLLLPHVTSETIMSIGPFLSARIDNRQILEIAENNSITPSKQSLLKDYYNSIPVLSDSDRLFTLIDTFAERIWGGVGSYKLVEINSAYNFSQQLLTKTSSDEQTDILVNMKLMETRYAYENEIMAAVSMGNDHKVANLISVLSEYTFEKRVADSLRNMKNYCIVMNTLLRKAAEDGGVHPVYLDDLSTNYAIKIEQLRTMDSVKEIMEEMFKSYCRLVRKHSTKKYSSPVQKAIMMINYDLSSNLTLSSLAKAQNISGGYLATIFKKETGKTVTEYIIDRRVEHAMRLLSTTRLQVQTVALHCGIMDVQYFSKIFKKKTGMTPKAYRETANIS